MNLTAKSEELRDFFSALALVAPNKYDMGLIVREKEKFSAEDLVSSLPKPVDAGRVLFFKLNKDKHPDEFLEVLVKGLKEKKWVVLELKDGYLPGRIYNQLSILANSNRLQIINLLGNKEGITEVKQPAESRLVVLIDRDILEKKIKYEHFVRLFGPVISL